MQNRYVLFVFEVRSNSFVGNFQNDFVGHPPFKDNLIVRTRRFIDLFVCVNFERVVFAGQGVSYGYMRQETLHYVQFLWEGHSYDFVICFQSIHCRLSSRHLRELTA